MGFLLKRKLDAMLMASILALVAGDAASQSGAVQWLLNATALPEWGMEGSAAALGAVLVGRVIYFTRRIINLMMKLVLFALIVVGAFYLGRLM